MTDQPTQLEKHSNSASGESRVQQLIFTSLLNAEMNHRYYAALAASYQSRDRVAKIVTAIAASATVSGLWLWDAPPWDRVWQVLSAVVAALAIAMSVWNLSTSSKTASELSGSWFSIMQDHESLWARERSLSEDAALRKCEAIRAREKPLAEKEATLWRRKGLLRRCQAEVRSYRQQQ